MAHHAKWGGEVVRILADGEHEAAVEKARAEALDAMASVVTTEKAKADADAEDWPAATAFSGAFAWVLSRIDEAKKGGNRGQSR